MKKIVLSLLGLTTLAACTGYDYYTTDLRYRQEGSDCVYYQTEKGKRFSDDINSLRDAKKVVYRNTRCEDLYNDDTFGLERNDRKAIVPVYTEENSTISAPKCGCSKCGKKRTLKNRYIIVPSYAG